MTNYKVYLGEARYELDVSAPSQERAEEVAREYYGLYRDDILVDVFEVYPPEEKS